VASSDPVCSVVIPTYNAARTLPEQLDALVRQTCTEPFEVVISDNNSTDDSAELARRWADRLDLRVVPATRRQGVSAARNDGIAAARTDLILICDADDVVSDEWVAAMLAGLREHDYVGGPLETRSLSGAAARWVPIPERMTGLLETWQGRTYPVGGNLGVRRWVVDAVGGFDEDYPAGAEEIDFAWRAGDLGVTPVFLPDAAVSYRIRDDVRGVLRQQFNSGLGAARLYAKFRPAEVPLRPPLRRAHHELLLLRRFPWRGGRDERIAWASTLAFEAG
jgi:glycosyltransferase involved in cell wall biosynthesis